MTAVKAEGWSDGIDVGTTVDSLGTVEGRLVGSAEHTPLHGGGGEVTRAQLED